MRLARLGIGAGSARVGVAPVRTAAGTPVPSDFVAQMLRLPSLAGEPMETAFISEGVYVDDDD